jgi:hypothetical protein
MSKNPTETDITFRPDLSRVLPPVDETVKPPDQVRLAAARAEDLIAGRSPPRAVAKRKRRSEPSISYSDAQIEQVLERWDQGTLNVTDPDFGIMVDLAREGARLTKAHRRGAREQTRKTSTKVRRRLVALIEAYCELSPKLRAHPTGIGTIERLRSAVIRRLGLPNNDNAVSEDTIRQNIRKIRPILRLIQDGVIPPSGKWRMQGPSEATRREIEAGRAQVEANKSIRGAYDPSKS